MDANAQTTALTGRRHARGFHRMVKLIDSGSIVNILSVEGLAPECGKSACGAAKALVAAISQRPQPRTRP